MGELKKVNKNENDKPKMMKYYVEKNNTDSRKAKKRRHEGSEERQTNKYIYRRVWRSRRVGKLRGKRINVKRKLKKEVRYGREREREIKGRIMVEASPE